MPTGVSQETSNKAREFIAPLEKMCELVDDVRFADGAEMTDGVYLEMMNTLQALNKLAASVRQTTIYVEVQRQAQARVANPRLSTAEMLRRIQRGDPKFMACPKCKKPMTTRHFKEKHSKSKTCTHIEVVREHQYTEGVKAGGGKKKKDIKKWTWSKTKHDYTIDIELKKCALMETIKTHRHNKYITARCFRGYDEHYPRCLEWS